MRLLRQFVSFLKETIETKISKNFFNAPYSSRISTRLSFTIPFLSIKVRTRVVMLYFVFLFCFFIICYMFV